MEKVYWTPMLATEYEYFLNRLKVQSIQECKKRNLCPCIKELVENDMIVITDEFSPRKIRVYIAKLRINEGSSLNYHGNEQPIYVYDYYHMRACPICGQKIDLREVSTLKIAQKH